MSKKYLHTQLNFSKFAFLCKLFDSHLAVKNIRKTTIKGGVVETLSVDCRFQIVTAPKKSELPISLRERIVSLCENGLSYREIGKKVNVCFSTVRYVLKKDDLHKITCALDAQRNFHCE
ncbi:hypothetical protein TNCV_2875921 [Trichonephila clavipes]|nr:hypothetical protein TNCV_2875921 [Trichonephila clavipes]